jgi:hypothetical protein
MEGVGVPPDYYVAASVEDYLNNTDVVLEFAVELLRDGKI